MKLRVWPESGCPPAGLIEVDVIVGYPPYQAFRGEDISSVLASEGQAYYEPDTMFSVLLSIPAQFPARTARPKKGRFSSPFCEETRQPKNLR